MKILKVIAIMLISCLPLQAATLVDMAGREVEIPDSIERLEQIMPYDTKTSVLLYSVAREKMVSRALFQGIESFTFMDDGYAQLPEVDVKNAEELLKIKPQLIIASAYIGSDNLERFDKLEKRTHIPVVIIDLSIEKMSDTYRFLGDMLGVEAKCDERAEFIERVYDRAQSLMDSNSAIKQSIYYTLGGDGLMTDPAGSRHTEVIDYMKLFNVVNVPIPSGGHASVNMEQVMVWNPDVIFCGGFRGNNSAYQLIKSSRKWRNIAAVKSEKVYVVPSKPFGWFDNPPSVNRVPGIIWLCEIFYGESSQTTRELIREFYRLFYLYDLSEAEYDSLFIL